MEEVDPESWRIDVGNMTGRYYGENHNREVAIGIRQAMEDVDPESWLEDVASMKSEAMLDLLDSIRDEMGTDVSSSFEQTVRPALDEIYLALEKNRQALAQTVGVLTGTGSPGAMGGAMGGMGPPDMGWRRRPPGCAARRCCRTACRCARCGWCWCR